MRQNLLLMLGTILALLLLGEMGIRISDAFDGKAFSSRRNRVVREPRSVRPFRMFGKDLYTEVDGESMIVSRHGELYPLAKPPDAFRIVCMGGSTTENIPSLRAGGTHYPLRLQELLRERTGRGDVEVINAGHSAYSTAHSLILLELNVIHWDPDLVILSHNINDLSAAWFPDFTFDYSNKYVHRPFVPEEVRTLPNLLLQNFQVYWVLKKRFAKLEKRLRGPTSSSFRRRSYGEQPPEAVVRVFEANLASFVAVARARDIEVVFGSQPLQPAEESFAEHHQWKEYNDIVDYPLHAEFVAHHRAFNAVMATVAADSGVPFVSNDAALGGRPENFTDHVHYTPAGVEALARSYADALLARGLLD